jgi:hypothetical protein
MKWEQEALENREKSSVHYQDIRYNGKFFLKPFISRILIF